MKKTFLPTVLTLAMLMSLAIADDADSASEGFAGVGGNLVLVQWQSPDSANPYLATGGTSNARCG